MNFKLVITPHRIGTLGACLVVVLVAVLAGSSAQAQIKVGLERYNECMLRKPFLFHTDGRESLAKTGTITKGLDLLVEDYKKTKLYSEYSRYTLATLFGSFYNNREALPFFDDLRKSKRSPEDVWMWVNTLTIQADQGGTADVVEIAQTAGKAVLRAAAIVALGLAKNSQIKDAIVANCEKFPSSEADRSVLLGAMSGALLENKAKVNDAEYRQALEAFIHLLAPQFKLSKTQILQMARHLQWIFNAPAMFSDEDSWLERLRRGEIKTPSKSGTTVSGSSFFGLETDGERFSYVIDMSDSMLKEISPDAKPAGPTTGPRKTKKKGMLDADDLPWSEIKTRWDLAREQLRVSLSRLSEDKHFSVIWFGSGAGTLESTKRMVKATKGNITQVMAELDNIKVSKLNAQGAEDGVLHLRGDTNVHAGLAIAFGISQKGVEESGAYVHSDPLTSGPDTIFLLSDGAPSVDEFLIADKDYNEGKVVASLEAGGDVPRSASLMYSGPYVQDKWLIEDLRRMNAFRRIRMHCIGLGEANMALLDKLAEMGHGEVFVFGKSRKK